MPDGRTTAPATDLDVAAVKAQLDEQRLARAVGYGLPLATVVTATVVGFVVGPAMAILVFAAGGLLGVIGLLWSSLRILSGDAPLSPELEALDMAAQGVDALASRKKMLLRAMKDLENEKNIGKLEEDDYEQISATYREELKAVLRRIDASLEPHREKAEALARTHLLKSGLAPEEGARDLPERAADVEAPRDVPSPTAAEPSSRVACPKCEASNERDAKFCKSCGAVVTPSATENAGEASDAH
jgi:hypothetical protein